MMEIPDSSLIGKLIDALNAWRPTVERWVILITSIVIMIQSFHHSAKLDDVQTKADVATQKVAKVETAVLESRVDTAKLVATTMPSNPEAVKAVNAAKEELKINQAEQSAK